MKKPLYIFNIIFILVCLSVFSCKSSSFEIQKESFHKENYLPQNIQWQKDRELSFLQTYTFENKKFPIKYTLVKLNLFNEEIEIVIKPDDKNESYKSSVKNFAKENECFLAFNTSPFDKKIAGLTINNKNKISDEVKKYSALAFFKREAGYTADIFVKQTDKALENADFACGGFFTVLYEGDFFGSYIHNDQARIAAAVSGDGKILYLLYAEKGLFNKSAGLSFYECAEIFKSLGCYKAIELDGGRSAEVFIKDREVYKNPLTRKQKAHLGFRLKK